MKVALLSTALALAACNQHVVTYDTSLPRGKVHSEWTGHYLYGSIGHTDINVRRICPEGAAKIETYRSFGNGMIGALTLGIYTPRTVRITCASGNTAIAALNAEGKIAYSIPGALAQEVAR